MLVIICNDRKSTFFNVEGKIPPRVAKLAFSEIFGGGGYIDQRTLIHKYFGIALSECSTLKKEEFSDILDKEPLFEKYKCRKPFSINPDDKVLVYHLSSDT
jgi:hypothetical protein